MPLSPMSKIAWTGRIISVQPRIRLMRSFDQSQHSYQGFALTLEGRLGDQPGNFTVGIGKAAQLKHGFEVGMRVSGLSVPVSDPRLESTELYKTSKLKRLEAAPGRAPSPPFHGPPPKLTAYRERGPRRLAAKTYSAACAACIWACRMPTELTIDHWNPKSKKYRFETFCYGPKSCALYRPGPMRKVPGRNGMSYTEEDWIDEDATAHRGLDD